MEPPRPAIVCSLDAAARGDRRGELAALAARGLIAATSTRGGARFSFRAEAPVVDELRRLVALEQACCPFFEFRLTADGGVLHLDVAAPEGHQPLAEALFGDDLRAWMRGGWAP